MRTRREIRTALGAGLASVLLAGTIGGVGLGVASAQSSAEISVTFEQGRTTPGPYAYEPFEVRVDVGATVTWENVDDLTDQSDNNAIDHPTRCSGPESKGKCPWGSMDLPPGGTMKVTFPQSGTFHYICSVHPYMEGDVIVGNGEAPTAPPPPPASEEPNSPPPPPPNADEDDEDDEDDAPPSQAAPTDEPASQDQTEPDEVSTPTDEATDASSTDDTSGGSGGVVVTDDAMTGTALDDQIDEDDSGENDDDDGGGAVKVIAGLLVLAVGGAAVWQWRR